jgi:hypothetical protein
VKQREDEVNVLTQQLVSQLTYQSSRLHSIRSSTRTEGFEQITSEILELIASYEKKVKKLKK